MRLGEALANAARLVRGSPETEISAVTYDSRAAKPGSLFCALPGTKSDGVMFVPEALSRGASAVIASRDLPGEFPLAIADDPRRAMALVASQLFKWPASKLTMLGVTGTNGKTTTAYFVEHAVRTAGRRAGLVGTVEWRYGDVRIAASHTTPESVELQGLLAKMVAAGTEFVAMEVSSHALAQSRVAGIRYRAAAFTNLTRDHLDFHGTMDAYFAAKATLFRENLAEGGTAILNGADPRCASLHAELVANGRKSWRFGIDDGAELCATGLVPGIDGVTFDLASPHGSARVTSPITGRHNVENLLAGAGLALAAGIPFGAVTEAMRTFHGAPGRLERVADPHGRRLFVDYAHTDDALARVLDTLRAVRPDGAKLITVFGCGGDRDRGKRPIMGRVAGEKSDLVIVTSDNPRTESPAAIIDEIIPGIEQSGALDFRRIEDRGEAIAAAVAAARAGDIVLVAGKGHEDYQLVGTEKRHFDDREQLRAATVMR